MNTFIQSMNQLPLHHEPETPFLHKPFLANLYSLFVTTYQSIDEKDITYTKHEVTTKGMARIRDDLKGTPTIQKDVLEKYHGDLHAHYNKNDVSITILFSLFSSSIKEVELYKRYVPWIIHWLLLAHTFSEKKCKNPVSLHLYLTLFEKKIRNIKEVLGESHVNTAYTWHCSPNNKIVIYRHEEWFKVLIHESFHFFGFEDFKKEDEKRLKECFPLQSELRVGEAYGEFWARVLNSFYCAYFINQERSRQSTVLHHFYRIMYVERIFSCYQALKILNYMNMSYTDLYSTGHDAIKKRNTYKENSNVFCYYILVSILMHSYQDTMIWCNSHNNKLFNISLQHSHLFVDYIKKICKQSSYLHNMEHLGSMYLHTDRSLRMTLLDFL